MSRVQVSPVSVTSLPGRHVYHDQESRTAPQIKRKLQPESFHTDGHAAVEAESPVPVAIVVPV